MSKKHYNQHLFSQVPKADIQRSRFKRDHGLKTAFNSGLLVPIFVDEVLPGDTFTLNASLFGRLATPIVPTMDNLYLETFWFFVPNRLIWDNFEKFMGAQDNPGDSTDYLVPKIKKTWTTNSIGDYFGIPVGKELEVNELPFRAYNLIWNEWFRDENLQDSVMVYKGDAQTEASTYPDPNDPTKTVSTEYTLLRRGKRYDYFTSCLPFPQKGPGVEISLADASAPVVGVGFGDKGTSGGGTSSNVNVYQSGYTSGAMNATYDYASQTNGGSIYIRGAVKDGHLVPDVTVDLTAVTAVTINSLRQAFQLQKLYERDARGGTRYIELLKAHFGVTSPDGRLQRPEYLGGSTKRITTNPVAQTSASDSVTPQANLAAFQTVQSNGHMFSKSFVEHGYIIGMAQVRADLTYQQGLDRMWTRDTRESFYFPVFAHLGEQAVLNREIYAQGTDEDNDVFGYQERYAEYRYKPSKITGVMRSNPTDGFETVDYWHYAQNFTDLPKLSSAFIQDVPPIERALAVPSEPQILLDCWFDLDCYRPMPLYSVPELVDHF